MGEVYCKRLQQQLKSIIILPMEVGFKTDNKKQKWKEVVRQGCCSAYYASESSSRSPSVQSSKSGLERFDSEINPVETYQTAANENFDALKNTIGKLSVAADLVKSRANVPNNCGDEKLAKAEERTWKAGQRVERVEERVVRAEERAARAEQRLITAEKRIFDLEAKLMTSNSRLKAADVHMRQLVAQLLESKDHAISTGTEVTILHELIENLQNQVKNMKNDSTPSSQHCSPPVNAQSKYEDAIFPKCAPPLCHSSNSDVFESDIAATMTSMVPPTTEIVNPVSLSSTEEWCLQLLKLLDASYTMLPPWLQHFVATFVAVMVSIVQYCFPQKPRSPE